MRQTQGIILGAWRANGNLSSCNLLASLDPPEFVLFHFTDGPDETCPPIAAILPTVRRFCCLSSFVSLHVRIRIVSYDAVLAAKSQADDASYRESRTRTAGSSDSSEKAWCSKFLFGDAIQLNWDA